MLLLGGPPETWIVDRHEARHVSIASGFEVVPIESPDTALLLLRRLCRETRTLALLRRLDGESRLGTSVGLIDDHAVLSRIARQLASSALVLIRRRSTVAATPQLEARPPTPREAARAAPPPAEPAPKTWIEIQLIGEDDQPIAGEKYRIELPDGSIKEGRLDSEGLASVYGLDPGECSITFPELDKEAWEPA